MKVFGLCGHSGSGKTTLMVKLVPLLVAGGLRVSTIKQANAGFDADKPGKDSYEHRAAGAKEVLVASAKRWALMHEYRGEPELSMEHLLARMSPVDLVLVEGFRHWPHPRIEVWRRAVGKPPLFPTDPVVVAVASPDCPENLNVPLLALDEADSIARFVLEQTGL
ncbi:molybdopterin-guanine dinucleotide biosynthesis protein B [Magnetospirillum sulfuroxidans]|uniref:Molybdopterin-guanine dinucleotide biosynthesis protein B n=1 Tax=Magnetospirillum sulfuroxidans TaxID=611300 RepID=A0ABS5IFP6_9PROT|nr:molybdopterin-guanine dinucleotide biosynthesis protein B [Magnetospirillum sulfuroxidans]MBR9973237.1 molybdopterin-guanine dinucleotide biosynthesis protein B [Magnetospirillum sulfuroxidans]